MTTCKVNAETGGRALLRRRELVRLLGAAPLLALAACVNGPGNGPPAHAPAWGRRRKLDWDPVLGAYIVVGLPGVYYVDPYYYRFADGGWLRSDDLDHWRPAQGRGLPPGLAKKHGQTQGKGRRK